MALSSAPLIFGSRSCFGGGYTVVRQAVRFRVTEPVHCRGGNLRLRSRGHRQRVTAEFEDSEKMHVPSDSFGGLSPERKASQHLQAFFTFVAVKVVLAQLEGVAPVSSLAVETDGGDGDRSAARINNDYDDLLQFYEQHPLRDADEWMKALVAHNSLLARRVMEVRKAYAEADFEWDSLQRLSNEGLQKSNDELMTWWMQQQYGAAKQGR
eukprot:CAMPEP_0177763756 /NCGR_PEP_ID=MMETSP0491_2-20121128/7036_1 /TAXON_ID=63592 /ORGANISM="Tetraselmis chuii, Strain PLY429" /LENGTH=209 /DNA_ID=CAMNT_0019279875 /DNA_START=181 /DNA_END=810 /DNA_ORIENTATION=+